MNVVYSARSHLGKVRGKNEDNLFVDGITLTVDVRDRPFSIDGNTSMPVILAVCDGMGGEENGEIASQIAVSKLAEVNEAIKSHCIQGMNEAVQNYINIVNSEIHSAFENVGKRVGTTLAMILITKEETFFYNIGDTRIYSLIKNSLVQITNDHTVVAEKVRNGVIPSELATFEKDKHKLTRCIGIGNSCTPESYQKIHKKCRLLICSDGLTDMVKNSEIEKILCDNRLTANAADKLLYAALVNGGIDNVTVIVADINPRTKFKQNIANKLRK